MLFSAVDVAMCVRISILNIPYLGSILITIQMIARLLIGSHHTG